MNPKPSLLLFVPEIVALIVTPLAIWWLDLSFEQGAGAVAVAVVALAATSCVCYPSRSS